MGAGRSRGDESGVIVHAGLRLSTAAIAALPLTNLSNPAGLRSNPLIALNPEAAASFPCHVPLFPPGPPVLAAIRRATIILGGIPALAGHLDDRVGFVLRTKLHCNQHGWGAR